MIDVSRFTGCSSARPRRRWRTFVLCHASVVTCAPRRRRWWWWCRRRRRRRRSIVILGAEQLVHTRRSTQRSRACSTLCQYKEFSWRVEGRAETRFIHKRLPPLPAAAAFTTTTTATQLGRAATEAGLWIFVMAEAAAASSSSSNNTRSLCGKPYLIIDIIRMSLRECWATHKCTCARFVYIS